MKAPSSGRWSELPTDILRSVLEQDGTGCRLYNPEEDSIYGTKRDFSGTRFLANSGNWFLVLDSRSNLYIMDVFSEKMIHLPPLESIKGGHFSLERVGDKIFSENEKKEEYVVVWFFGMVSKYIAYCKNGEDHYRDIPTRTNVPRELRGLSDIVLHGGDSLYIFTARQLIRKLVFFGQEGFMDVYKSDTLLLRKVTLDHISGGRFHSSIAVTTAGEVLLVQNFFYEITRYRNFRVFKKDPNPDPDAIIDDPNHIVEVHSLGDEALLLDLGITVWNCSCMDICVFSLATKKLKRFPDFSPSDIRFKDARWFLPS
ncbi:PREDICTED: probable F-box protein At5g25300 [Camelina sativa]|uniref:Probable F-box protein At5g25300 n=1 Tax=Camelina sativa TaxID=90675 RepID=A0ABM1REJ9_CAMSA|nr:PREDICTED: probable F-box protein At5g25300 [Camelina sativa]